MANKVVCVTAHLSMTSVPITVLLYNGPLLCGFNVPIKRLNSPNGSAVQWCAGRGLLFLAASTLRTVSAIVHSLLPTDETMNSG